jgi:glycerol-3-phosphate acyltransferase PlsY
MFQTLLWIAIGFVAGSLPFSVWVGRFALGRDIRTVGDQNPGATNVFRAGGKGWGALAMVLDFFKGAIPVLLATFWAGLEGWGLVLAALAPVFGHAYSPFLRFRGGKALATSFGIWFGLTIWYVPTVLGITFTVGMLVLASPGWTVVLGMVITLVALFAAGAPWVLYAVWAGNFGLLLWKHRAEYSRPPQWERGVLKRFLRNRPAA